MFRTEHWTLNRAIGWYFHSVSLWMSRSGEPTISLFIVVRFNFQIFWRTDRKIWIPVRVSFFLFWWENFSPFSDFFSLIVLGSNVVRVRLCRSNYSGRVEQQSHSCSERQSRHAGSSWEDRSPFLKFLGWVRQSQNFGIYNVFENEPNIIKVDMKCLDQNYIERMKNEWKKRTIDLFTV